MIIVRLLSTRAFLVGLAPPKFTGASEQALLWNQLEAVFHPCVVMACTPDEYESSRNETLTSCCSRRSMARAGPRATIRIKLIRLLVRVNPSQLPGIGGPTSRFGTARLHMPEAPATPPKQ
jgi:hypothetical protein